VKRLALAGLAALSLVLAAPAGALYEEGSGSRPTCGPAHVGQTFYGFGYDEIQGGYRHGDPFTCVQYYGTYGWLDYPDRDGY
jgi:hypothetical protein